MTASNDNRVPAAGKPRIACVSNTSFSGFTIFCLLANSHPEIVALGDGLNPRVLRSRGEHFVCSCGRVLMDCEFWSAVFADVQEQGVPFSLRDCNLRYSFVGKVKSRVLGRYFDDPLRATARRLALAAWPSYRRHVALHTARNVAFARAVTRCSGKQVYIHNAKPLLVLYYLRNNPDMDVKVINMVRDARGFINSAVKRGASVRDASLRWRRYHRRVADITRDVDPSKSFTLKYEELCGNTEECMRSVYRFLGVADAPVSRTIIPADHHIAGNDLRLKDKLDVRLDEDWQSRFGANDLRIIEEICRPTCAELGYDW